MLGDLAVAFSQGARLALPTRGEIATRFARLRYPGQAIRHHLPVDQQNTLVTVNDLGKVALRHHGPRTHLRHRFNDHGQVRIVSARPEDRRTTHTIQQLEHRLMMLMDESAQIGAIAAHNRRRNELGELEDRELLVMGEQSPGGIEHPGTGLRSAVEQPHGVQIFRIERRVLSHQDRIKGLQCLIVLRRQLPPDRRPPAGVEQRQLRRFGPDTSGAIADRGLLTDKQAMTPTRGLDHHGKAAVLDGLQRFEWIDDEQPAHAQFLLDGANPKPGCDRVPTDQP